MKTKVLLLLTMLFALSSQAQKRVNGARVGYIDMEYILENVTAYKEANTQLEAKAQRWKAEMQKKQGEIDQMKKNLSAERVLLTKELVDEREEEIQLLAEELEKYQQDRFGPNGSLMIQRQNLVKPIQDQVLNAVQDIAKKRRYDFVFDKSADVVMLYSSKKFDISDLVLRTINRDVKREGRAAKLKKQSEKTKFDDTEKEVDPEVEAKKQAVADKKAERQKLLDERKQKRLEDREAKKKAYEEKRKKLIADREAKKKAAEEKRKKRAEEKKKKEEEREQQKEENENEGSGGAGNGK
ncbi:OmpH family outer membrane protein [Kordia jejudonensis]|uniref:OmpH family outer membrane protein n=1 Tax=Kordia jejudonensis TaxID=1348245 RepID=UPI0006299508|nr:OmpH family outer membrane protein [Kordia jejudonensis]